MNLDIKQLIEQQEELVDALEAYKEAYTEGNRLEDEMEHATEYEGEMIEENIYAWHDVLREAEDKINNIVNLCIKD